MDRKLAQIFGGSKHTYGKEGYKQLEDYRTPSAQECFAKIDEFDIETRRLFNDLWLIVWMKGVKVWAGETETGFGLPSKTGASS